MIDKEQFPAVLLMIKEVYQPVMMRALVNLVLIDITQITFGFPDVQVRKILATEKCRNALLDSLEQYHRPRKHDLIEEILKQYGLALRKDEQEFYHRHMGMMFDNQVDYVKTLLQGFKFKHLYNLSKVQAH